MVTTMTFDELAREVFSFLCHQDPSRTFHPGGEPLAMCARCVGVYAGFLLAWPMMIIVGRLPQKLAMYLHGLFVLQMIPFGFHLIPHGLTIRSISGQLFALGAVYFLYMAIRHSRRRTAVTRISGIHTGRWLIRYLLVTAQAVVLLQLLLRTPWLWAAALVNVLALAGLGVFVGLVITFLLGLAGFIAVSGKSARYLP